MHHIFIGITPSQICMCLLRQRKAPSITKRNMPAA